MAVSPSATIDQALVAELVEAELNRRLEPLKAMDPPPTLTLHVRGGAWHWLIPVALLALGLFFLSQASADRGFLGTATTQSIGDAAAAFMCWAMALGYCLGRWVAWLQWRRPRPGI